MENLTISNAVLLELASELAHNRAKDNLFNQEAILNEDDMFIEDEDGTLNYTDVAQDEFNDCYDYYLDVINKTLLSIQRKPIQVEKENINEHVLSIIDLSEYEMDNTIENLFDIFKIEYGYFIDRDGEREAFCEWCKGLPSALNVLCYYDEVREFLYSVNLPVSEDDTYNFDLYLNTIFAALKELKK